MSVEQQIADNDHAQSNMNNILYSYTGNSLLTTPFYTYNSDIENQIKNEWDVNNSISKAYKELNKAEEGNIKANYLLDEKNALKEAINSNKYLKKIIKEQQNTYGNPELETKVRIVDINNSEFRQKQTLINQLMYFIYFIIYAVSIGIVLMGGFISNLTFSILFFIGLIYFIVLIRSTENFWKSYGDLSMSSSKSIGSKVIQAIAPIKKCPSNCVKK